MDGEFGLRIGGKGDGLAVKIDFGGFEVVDGDGAPAGDKRGVNFDGGRASPKPTMMLRLVGL